MSEEEVKDIEVSATVRDVDGTKLVEAYAKLLKKKGDITLPKWVEYVKTSYGKQASPKNPDWFFMRCASICRKLFLHPNKGINWLTLKYSTNKNNGSKPEHAVRGSRSVIRRCLKELEKIGLVKGHSKKGRSLTAKGRQELNELATQILSAEQQ